MFIFVNEMLSGYSGKPLAKKLSLKAGFKMRLINPPAYYYLLLSDMPEAIKESDTLAEKKDFIHFFTTDEQELLSVLPGLKEELTPAGMIWVSWPKKASGVPTTVTENKIRDIALQHGLVDIKVCAIDETWSGLKLVIPVKDRPKNVG